ncbi:hypothetical protein GCM10017643_03740 [Ancylobacter dichloromethanicus]|uniref:Spy/CpxP family protein refolding chaperone n=2 Tax=Ancylobacter dichloromethanicus TaxID=518825 RepID=A0A9W6J6E5_9HYPH|nr:hypothetical protein GCM10017643_03740 [Ancylobacter dichloromethanicus]
MTTHNAKESAPMIKMPSISILLFSAMLLAGSPASANDEHHPAGGAEAPATPLNAPGSQIPMGGMMSMMGTGGMPMMGMMTGRVEGRLAFLKTEIKITDVQESKWNVFADAVRANAKAMMGMREGMMQARDGALPVRLERIEKAMALCQEALQKIKVAVEPLYASFSEEQKRTADQLMVSPMGLF